MTAGMWLPSCGVHWHRYRQAAQQAVLMLNRLKPLVVLNSSCPVAAGFAVIL